MSKTMQIPPHESEIIRVTLAGTVTAGDWVDLTTGVGQYLDSGVSGDVVAVAVGGQFRVTAETGAWSAGETAWLDADNVTFNNADTGSDNKAGIIVEDKGSGVLVGVIKLQNPMA